MPISPSPVVATSRSSTPRALDHSETEGADARTAIGIPGAPDLERNVSVNDIGISRQISSGKDENMVDSGEVRIEIGDSDTDILRDERYVIDDQVDSGGGEDKDYTNASPHDTPGNDEGVYERGSVVYRRTRSKINENPDLREEGGNDTHIPIAKQVQFAQ